MTLALIGGYVTVAGVALTAPWLIVGNQGWAVGAGRWGILLTTLGFCAVALAVALRWLT